jgi:hypothetical protein
LSALQISFIVFDCVLGSAVLGMLLRSVLPEHHVNEDSKYIVKSGMGLLATLAALVLGLLIASAKSSFDSKQDEIKEGAAKIILLDRTLRHYGPEADPARTVLRRLTAAQTVFWLAVIFGSIGLFAPRHGIVYAVIFASALSVSSAIFLILQLDRPFEGLMAMSDAPLRDAIAELNR